MVAHELLRALLEQREALGRAVPSPAAAPRGNPLADRVRYRACPHCRQMMNRKNFGGTSGIVVDVCAVHGTFFDAGELPRVLEFVRRGGLAKAPPAPSLQGPSSARVVGTGVLPAPAPTTLLDDLAGLASFVVEVLTRR
jgi:Zn-finger nucleic acid-binding protein